MNLFQRVRSASWIPILLTGAAGACGAAQVADPTDDRPASEFQVAGIFYHQWTGPFPGHEWTEFRPLGSDSYLVTDLQGGGRSTATIHAGGRVTITGAGRGTGECADSDTCTFRWTFGNSLFISRFVRVPTTSAAFPLGDSTPFEGPADAGGEWLAVFETLENALGVVRETITRPVEVSVRLNHLPPDHPGRDLVPGCFFGRRPVGVSRFGAVVHQPNPAFPGSSHNVDETMVGLGTVGQDNIRLLLLLQGWEPAGSQTLLSITATR